MTEKNRIELTPQQAIGLLQNERAKLQAIQEELFRVRSSLEDGLQAKSTLQAVKKAQQNESILIPLGAGVLLHGALVDNENVQVTLGGGVLKKDSISDAIEKLDNRQREAEQQLAELQKQFNETNANVENLSQMLQAIAQRAQKNATPTTSPVI